jgi:hypothetical protein
LRAEAGPEEERKEEALSKPVESQVPDQLEQEEADYIFST